VLEVRGVLGEEGEVVSVSEALLGVHPVAGFEPFVPTSLPVSTLEPPLDPEPQPQPQPVSGASPGNKIQMTIDSGATNMCVHPLLPLSLAARQEKGCFLPLPNLSTSWTSTNKTRYLSTEIADYLASLFSPPAVFSHRSNAYTVPCTSIPPRFAVVIEGVPFYVDPQDLVSSPSGSVKRDRMGAGTGEEELNAGARDGRMCVLSVLRSGTGDSVLGDAWLKGVVAVFDVGGECCLLFGLRGEVRECTTFLRANLGQIM